MSWLDEGVKDFRPLCLVIYKYNGIYIMFLNWSLVVVLYVYTHTLPTGLPTGIGVNGEITVWPTNMSIVAQTKQPWHHIWIHVLILNLPVVLWQLTVDLGSPQMSSKLGLSLLCFQIAYYAIEQSFKIFLLCPNCALLYATLLKKIVQSQTLYNKQNSCTGITCTKCMITHVYSDCECKAT